jgi:hypothetical protein
MSGSGFRRGSRENGTDLHLRLSKPQIFQGVAAVI